MKVAIASLNPVKYNATRLAFKRVFPHESFELTCLEVNHEMPRQPFGDDTVKGAMQRAKKAQEKIQGDFAVGIEAGIYKTAFGNFTMAWCAITNRKNIIGLASSGSILLPDRVMQLVEEKQMELGEAVDTILGAQDTKQKEGFSGYISKNLIDRTNHYIDMIIYALSRFYHREAFDLLKKNIYFTGSSEGSIRYQKNYTAIVNLLHSLGHHVFTEYMLTNTLLAMPSLKADISREEHAKTNEEQRMAWINESDLVIAEVSEPSLNLGFEIAYAVSRQIPVIAIYDKSSSNHITPMMAGKKSQYIHILEYTLDTIEALLKNAIDTTSR